MSPTWWTAACRQQVITLLEADGDPHLQRLDDHSLRLQRWEVADDGRIMLEVTCTRLTYGGCGAPAGCTPEVVRLRGRLEAGVLQDLA